MKRLIAFLALAAALAFPMPGQAFKGCAVGVHTGASAAHSEVSVLGVEDNGATVSALIGTSISCHAPITGSSFYFGAQADLDFYKRIADQPILFGATGSAPSRRAAVAAQLGYMANDKTGIYAELGWGWSWDKDLVLAPGMALDMPSQSGPIAGVGIETKIFGETRFTASYRAAFYRDEDIQVGALGMSINREPQDHTVRMGFKIPFLVPAETAAAKPLK